MTNVTSIPGITLLRLHVMKKRTPKHSSSVGRPMNGVSCLGFGVRCPYTPTKLSTDGVKKRIIEEEQQGFPD